MLEKNIQVWLGVFICLGADISAHIVTARRAGFCGGRDSPAGQNHAFLTLECLDPGSGRDILAIWHGASAYHDVLIT